MDRALDVREDRSSLTHGICASPYTLEMEVHFPNAKPATLSVLCTQLQFHTKPSYNDNADTIVSSRLLPSCVAVSYPATPTAPAPHSP